MKLNLKLLSILFLSVVIFSCSKDGGDDPQPNNPSGNPPPTGGQQISAPTGNYTKKALLEYHTAAWCSTCPDAEVKREEVMNNYPNRIIPVAIHQSDAMQIPLFMALDANFGSNPAYGMINRVPSLNNVLLNRTQWMGNANVQLAVASKCGLAIKSSVSGTTASVEVQAAFKQVLSGTYHLTVYLVEKDVTGSGSGYDQANSYNTDPSSPYYNMGNPIVGYRHPFVVRKVLTSNMGDPIDASYIVVDGLLKKNYTVSVAGMNASNIEIIAFVNKLGTSSTTHEVMNAQRATLGTLKNWD